ncbi:hypothetical protein IC582_001864 [Cucumis melo]
MSFGLCNAPRTFRRCNLTIFSNFLERSIEIFMDNFSVFRDSFKECLSNLEEVLEKCEEMQLILNWEKCHFMVKEEIVLGHKISHAGLKVDPVNIDVVSKLPPPSNVKPLKSFLGHVGFYRRFIRGFSHIAKLLSNQLCDDQPYNFDEKCNQMLQTRKDVLTSAPILITLDWSQPFEIMCHTSCKLEIFFGLFLLVLYKRKKRERKQKGNGK